MVSEDKIHKRDLETMEKLYNDIVYNYIEGIDKALLNWNIL